MKRYKTFKLQVVKGKKEYYRVFIFKNRLDMRLGSKQMIKKHDVSHMEAATHSYDAYEVTAGKKTLSDNIGAIMLYEGGFSHGVVSHEVAHAVNYYFLKKHIDFNLGDEAAKQWKEADETYATILGYMVNQFWKKYGVKAGKERY